MALLGERIPAAKAVEWGLATRVHPNDEHRAESLALLRRLADGPTRAYAGIKRELNATVFAGLEEQLELEARIQDEAEQTADHQEGVAAFMEKRPTRYTGA
jgi:2-(1,2-epoxy-1,2-dihydrophenyl)acetyl-CoA isomerase